jgi:nitrogen fixation NifU-like protein
MAYSEKVLDHYENPRNVGAFEKGDDSVGTGMVGAPACGDVMKLQIKVGADGVIEDAKFKTYGCGSAIASSSLVTEWVKGKTLDQALAIKNTQIAEELALPPVKSTARFWPKTPSRQQFWTTRTNIRLAPKFAELRLVIQSRRRHPRGAAREESNGYHPDRKSSETHQPLHRASRQRHRPAFWRAHDGLLRTGLQARIRGRSGR